MNTFFNSKMSIYLFCYIANTYLKYYEKTIIINTYLKPIPRNILLDFGSGLEKCKSKGLQVLHSFYVCFYIIECSTELHCRMNQLLTWSAFTAFKCIDQLFWELEYRLLYLLNYLVKDLSVNFSKIDNRPSGIYTKTEK